MTVYVSDQVDQLRDLLDDAGDTQVTFANKIMYLNRGQSAMWPRVFRVVQDATTQFVDDQYEYVLPAAVRGGHLTLVEFSSPTYPDDFLPMDLDDYQIVPGVAGADILRLTRDPNALLEDGYIRFTGCLPLTTLAPANYAAAQSLAYSGPDHTVEGPVLYAMSRISAKPLDKRMDFEKISVQNQNRAASPQEFLAVSAFWLDEFERRLEEWKLTMPPARY